MKQIKQQGFTLIELMIVVLIVSILAAIAYPSYQEQVRASRRADATGALEGLAGAMERHFTVNGTYVGATVGDTAADVYPDHSSIDVAHAARAYDLSLGGGVLVAPAPTATTYTLVASPVGDQANDKCATLTLTNTGIKNQTGAGVTVADCWK